MFTEVIRWLIKEIEMLKGHVEDCEDKITEWTEDIKKKEDQNTVYKQRIREHEEALRRLEDVTFTVSEGLEQSKGKDA